MLDVRKRTADPLPLRAGEWQGTASDEAPAARGEGKRRKGKCVDALLAGDEDAACKATAVESPSPVAEADTLGDARGASDTALALSVRGPICDVPDSPEQARAAAEEAAPSCAAPGAAS